MANENGALWQVQDSAANGTEATAGASNTVLFNPDSYAPNDGAFIEGISISLRKSTPEGQSVNSDYTAMQDMGLSGLDVTIRTFVGDADSTTSTDAIPLLVAFQKGSNAATGYTKGRFGLRLDNAPQWNVDPTSTYGYHIRDIQYDYVPDESNMCMVTIRLTLGGDVASAI